MDDRSGYIGGSDAYRLMKGQWLELYEEKLGLRPPEDLSDNFQVQLGKCTESLHLDWASRSLGLIDRGESACFKVHPEYPFIAGHVDGWVGGADTLIEVKHVHARYTKAEVVQVYLPQLAHYCNVFGRRHCWFSWIAGNAAPEPVEVTPPIEYRHELIELEKALWWCIENRSPPDMVPKKILGRMAELSLEVKIDGFRTLDMTDNNAWAVAAFDYISTLDGAKKNEEAKAAIKALVEADVAEASGHGVCVRRNKKGTLILTLKEET